MTYSLDCVSCGATVRLYCMPPPNDPPQCYPCAVRERRIFELLSAVPGGTTPGRAAKLRHVLAEHPNARVQICADERTGRRYGLAACRRGRAVKLGYRTYHYQVWAVWDAEEVHLAQGADD